MIIAVNTRLLLKDKLEGIGRFSFEILKRVTNAHKEHTFLFFFDRPFDERFIFSDNIIPVVLFPPARHPFLWWWFFEISVSHALKKYKADIYISPDGWMPLNSGIRTLQVLHDLHYENYPEFLPFLTRKYYQYFFPKFVKKATRIITVSNFCKDEISAKYGIAPGAIDVIYNSTREEYFPETEELKEAVRLKYTGGHLFFLFIGPVHPRKNLDNIVKAFALYKRKYGSSIKLVVTGATMWRNFGSFNQKDSAFASDIIMTGYLPPDELFRITAAAECLLYVSFYEGFGMPVLEAMSCNVPVITSNCSSMPEVAGDAAIFADPASVEAIGSAMYKILSDAEIRQTLILKGKSNLERFSWDHSAGLFWESIMKTMTG